MSNPFGIPEGITVESGTGEPPVLDTGERLTAALNSLNDIVEVIHGYEDEPEDKFWAIAGLPVPVEASDVREGYQRIKRKETPKANGESAQTSTGTPTNESGNDDDEVDDLGDKFYYCYTCKDTWELDEDGYLDLACPYCGAGPAEFTIVEMNDDVVQDLYDDLPFFHM